MKKLIVLGCTLILILVLSSCQSKDYEKEVTETSREVQQSQAETQKNHAPSSRENTDLPPQTDGFTVMAVENLGLDNRLITDQFYKAGDIRYSLTFSCMEENSSSNQLECDFSMPDRQSPSEINRFGTAEFVTEQGKNSYEITPEIYEGNSKTEGISYTVLINSDPASALYVSVEGNGELEGDYYPLFSSHTFPSLFTRCLSKADLCMWPADKLKLLRNEIYAAHGRKFDSEILNEYFSKFNWYRGVIEPEDFSEAVLSDIEKKNITLIQQMENDIQQSLPAETHHNTLDDLPDAPYLSFLGLHRETGVYADLSQAKDMGAYYVVPGSIRHPVSITQEQFQMLTDGGEVEVILNELTGKKAILTLELSEDSPFSPYMLYENGQIVKGYGIETGIHKDYEAKTYILWQTSDDTVMKTVYQGDIFILKGAVIGFDTGLAGASMHQLEIFPEPETKGQEAFQSDQLFGNCLFYNEKGYFTAIYALGD